MSEVEKREVEEREFEEKCCISSAWYEEKLPRETQKEWILHGFHFYANMRRKEQECDSFIHFPFLSLTL